MRGLAGAKVENNSSPSKSPFMLAFTHCIGPRKTLRERDFRDFLLARVNGILSLSIPTPNEEWELFCRQNTEFALITARPVPCVPRSPGTERTTANC